MLFLPNLQPPDCLLRAWELHEVGTEASECVIKAYFSSQAFLFLTPQRRSALSRHRLPHFLALFCRWLDCLVKQILTSALLPPTQSWTTLALANKSAMWQNQNDRTTIAERRDAAQFSVLFVFFTWFGDGERRCKKSYLTTKCFSDEPLFCFVFFPLKTAVRNFAQGQRKGGVDHSGVDDGVLIHELAGCNPQNVILQ